MKELTPLKKALREATALPWHQTWDGGTGCPQFHSYGDKTKCGSPKPVMVAGHHFREDGLVTGKELPEVRMDEKDARAIVLSVNLAPLLLRVAECAERLANCKSPEDVADDEEAERAEDECSEAWQALNGALTALRAAGKEV